MTDSATLSDGFRVDSERVTVEVRGRTLIITMIRHPKRNAVDAKMSRALDAALNELDDNPELRVGVLTGGPDMFCAGTDLADGPGPPTERGGIYGTVGRYRRKPLIAAVEGVAFGGGFEIVMATDVVVASTSARFGLPEVRRGLVATSGALFRASRVLPLNVAKYLLLTGVEIDSAEAHRLGLVNVVTDAGQALDAALEVAATIESNAPVAVQQSLSVVDQMVSADDVTGWDLTRQARKVISSSEDAAEGVAAFFERRAPEWKGR